MITKSITRQSPAAAGLRVRKKVKTKIKIQDAALALFAKKGFDATTVEEIADKAEISAATFFRYFPGKADVLLLEQDEYWPILAQAISARPAEEDDLLAVRRALQEVWVATIDPQRTARVEMAVRSSLVLRGRRDKIGRRWLAAVTEALARRRGLKAPNERCELAARAAFGVIGFALDGWLARGAKEPLSAVLDRSFDAMNALCNEWVAVRRQRKT